MAQSNMRCWNSHDALVKALRDALGELEYYAECHPPNTRDWDTPEQHPTHAAILQGRAALAMAEGKT